MEKWKVARDSGRDSRRRNHALMAESTNGRHKTRCIHGPERSRSDTGSEGSG